MGVLTAVTLACLPVRSLEVASNSGWRNKQRPQRVLAPTACATQAIFRRNCALARLDWKHDQGRFDPTIMLTVLLGLATAAFLATAL